MDSQSLHGRQPFALVLFKLGRKVAPTGRELGFDGGYAIRVANGRVAPSPEFRAALSTYLGIDERELFTRSALSATYLRRKNARGVGTDAR